MHVADLFPRPLSRLRDHALWVEPGAGNFERAAQFHPLGPVIVPVIAALGVLAILPRRWREAVREHVMRRAALLKPLYWGGIYAFAFFGALRWTTVFLGLTNFPATWP